MSCIATIYQTTEERYKVVLALAKNVRTIESGWWIFKRRTVIGKSEYDKAYSENLIEVETLRYSGYTLLEVEEIAQNNQSFALPVEIGNEKELELIFGYGGYVLRTNTKIAVPSDDIIKRHLSDKGQDIRDPSVCAVRAAYEFFNQAAEMVTGDSIMVIGLY